MRHGNGSRSGTRFQAPLGQPIDLEVVEFREAFEARSTLDEIIREGARKMLQTAIETEVDDFVAHHADRRDEHGKRLVVRNGYLPSRELLSGAGILQVKQPRVRDNAPTSEDRVFFSPSVLPPYLRRSKSVDELIPWLYLKGISTGDFSEALPAFWAKTRRISAQTSSFDSRRNGRRNTKCGVDVSSPRSITFTSGPTASTSMSASRTTRIAGNACWF